LATDINDKQSVCEKNPAPTILENSLLRHLLDIPKIIPEKTRFLNKKLKCVSDNNSGGIITATTILIIMID